MKHEHIKLYAGVNMKVEGSSYMQNSRGKLFEIKNYDDGLVTASVVDGNPFGTAYVDCGREKAKDHGDARRIAHDYLDQVE
jgi:hypothetical protein